MFPYIEMAGTDPSSYKEGGGEEALTNTAHFGEEVEGLHPPL
jgi:hypothetical protein